MKILFLDDNKDRHKTMRQNSIGLSVSFVFNAQEAITQMKENEFDLIMLDHDLDYLTNNEINEDEEDGRFVARWMAENGRHTSTPVIIHSLNIAGAEGMKYVLEEKGFEEVHCLPFAWIFIEKDTNGNIKFDPKKRVTPYDYS